MPVVLKNWRSTHINGAVFSLAEEWTVRARSSSLNPNPGYAPFQAVLATRTTTDCREKRPQIKDPQGLPLVALWLLVLASQQLEGS